MLSSSTFCRLDRTKETNATDKRSRYDIIYRHSTPQFCRSLLFSHDTLELPEQCACCNLALTKLSPIDIPPPLITDLFTCQKNVNYLLRLICDETVTKIISNFIIRLFYFKKKIVAVTRWSKWISLLKITKMQPTKITFESFSGRDTVP